jgi:cellulose synthase/poly-beta-1,6-N-acetylglucosamine synthase-like glycosyltransferase
MLPTVSVVVVTRKGGGWLEECIKSILNQNYPHDRYQVIVVGDFDASIALSELAQKYGVRVIGLNGKPGAKRNIALREVDSDIVAFCDDDVIVDREWLKTLTPYFTDPRVAVIGGPNLTPLHSNLRERCSGYIFSSFLGSAAMTARYLPDGTTVREADETDLISCNMAVRKSILDELGGFPEDIWPNEENILLHLIKKAGYKLLYVPNAIVWHRRRPIFLEHVKQNFRYGRGRGRMTRRHPDSVKPIHFLPSIFILLAVIGLIASIIGNTFIKLIYMASLSAYFLIICVESLRISIRGRDYLAFPLLPAAFFLHHCSYGLGFIVGLLGSDE